MSEVRRWTIGSGRAIPGVVLATVTLAVAVACVAPVPPYVPEPEPQIVEPVPDPSKEVRGYVDAHAHLFSYLGFGGELICGAPFDPDGIAEALEDCPSHMPNGELALFDNVIRNGSIVGTHDTIGWPTFKEWPAHDSPTHQQAYYEWVRRAWEGGLRVLVNDFVSSRQLCELWTPGELPCDEMEAIRLQADAARDLEAFIDSTYGGDGEGWFRIVKTSAEARRVIAEGKLAVILGVETSEPFGCRVWDGAPTCTKADIDKGLDEMHALGVRSMFVCHKLDNALCGVRFDPDGFGVIVNVANKLSTNRFWQAEPCPTPASDNQILGLATLPPSVAGLVEPGHLPLYPEGRNCNRNGLTDLGRYMIEGMIARNMLVEIDHMSVKAADQTLTILERAGYPGVISSHSWADPAFFDRIYALGGMVTQYGADSEEFVSNWQESAEVREAHGVRGYGVGTDVNGFGPLPAPPAQSSVPPVSYPFKALGGRSFDRARTGLREWDYNAEGMAHYGLLPDWFEDLRLRGGSSIAEDMARGAEQYLATLGSAEAHG